MKQISSRTSIMYQVVFPVFFTAVMLFLMFNMFKYPLLKVFFLIYLAIYILIVPLFYELKYVWLNNEYLIIRNISGKKMKIDKKDIVEISQNYSMITPRIIKVVIQKDDGTQQFFRFIPSGGYWIFWQHPIAKELERWRSINV